MYFKLFADSVTNTKSRVQVLNIEYSNMSKFPNEFEESMLLYVMLSVESFEKGT